MKTPRIEDNRTIPTIDQDPALSKEVKTFLQTLNDPGACPLESIPPVKEKQIFVDLQASVNVDISGIEEFEKTITTEGFSITLTVMRPHGAKGILPVFIFIHGGGWVFGNYPTHKRMVRDLVVLSGAPVVFVNHTRTLDAKYPQTSNEIYSAQKWIADHGHEIKVDCKQLVVVGNSVGGNMTALTALKAKLMGGPYIKLLIMMWPIVDADFETDSFKGFGKERFLSASLMKWMYDFYTTDPLERKEIYASPLRASLKQLKGLTPKLIQVAEAVILRDEGEAFGRKLDEAGEQVTTIRHNGVIRDFGLLNSLAKIPQTRSLLQHASANLKYYLA